MDTCPASSGRLPRPPTSHGYSDYSRYVTLADLSLQDQAPIREGINLAQTLYNSLAQIFRDGYDLIISTHSETLISAHYM